jgi:hypothetical protein
MNKLFLAALFALVVTTAFAQDEIVVDEEFETEIEQTQEVFKEITLDKLPKAITAAIKVGYPRFSIKKAYVSDAKHYKMEVPVEAGEVLSLYMDANGHWLEM